MEYPISLDDNIETQKIRSGYKISGCPCLVLSYVKAYQKKTI